MSKVFSDLKPADLFSLTNFKEVVFKKIQSMLDPLDRSRTVNCKVEISDQKDFINGNLFFCFLNSEVEDYELNIDEVAKKQDLEDEVFSGGGTNSDHKLSDEDIQEEKLHVDDFNLVAIEIPRPSNYIMVPKSDPRYIAIEKSYQEKLDRLTGILLSSDYGYFDIYGKVKDFINKSEESFKRGWVKREDIETIWEYIMKGKIV